MCLCITVLCAVALCYHCYSSDQRVWSEEAVWTVSCPLCPLWSVLGPSLRSRGSVLQTSLFLCRFELCYASKNSLLFSHKFCSSKTRIMMLNRDSKHLEAVQLQNLIAEWCLPMKLAHILYRNLLLFLARCGRHSKHIGMCLHTVSSITVVWAWCSFTKDCALSHSSEHQHETSLCSYIRKRLKFLSMRTTLYGI